MYLDSLCVELEAVFGDEELLDIFTLIALELDHLAHLTVGDDCAIASCDCLSICPGVGAWTPSHIPNFFLMTLRIFF